MAIDTANKRRSAVSTPWSPCYPVADNTVGAADRAQAAGYYAGFTYTVVAVTLVAADLWTATGSPRVLTVEGERTLTVAGTRTLKVDSDRTLTVVGPPRTLKGKG